MSQLPNAPLLEVIFELRWNILIKEELQKWQYLHGDLYNLIKDKYPHRELIGPPVPVEMMLGNPVHRYRVAENDYPLVQLGPGILTVNTNDKNYSWNEYLKEIVNVIQKLFKLHKPSGDVSLNLQYVDFLTFAYSDSDILEFLSKNLKIDLRQHFYKSKSNPFVVDLGLEYKIGDDILSIVLNTGANNDVEGMILRTIVKGDKINSEIDAIIEWIENSHKVSSQLFKDMTTGDLYNHFLNDNLQTS